jgi:hypothetical protein
VGLPTTLGPRALGVGLTKKLCYENVNYIEKQLILQNEIKKKGLIEKEKTKKKNNKAKQYSNE